MYWNQSRFYHTATVGFVVGAFAGCGGGQAPAVSSSKEEAQVKGVVSLQGKPLNNGRVLFSPVNIKRTDAQARQAQIGKDGTYSLTTLVGDNLVQIDCRELQLPKNRAIADTERSVVVKSGENVIDLKIPPE
ncbi:MAG: hypothetical protein ACKO85_14130 [Isosphaeraceae bacterium]